MAILGLAVFTLIFLLSKVFGGGSSDVKEVIPAGTPPVVIVTVLDHERPSDFEEAIKKNREEYAALHSMTYLHPEDTLRRSQR